MRSTMLQPSRPPEWQEAAADHLWMPYCQMKTAPSPLPVESTEGVRIRLSDGRELIDAMASWWCACHGYNHPHIVDAMVQQAQRMPHVMMGGLQHQPAADLARRLADLLPGDLSRVFLCDSGSVAVEVAMKMAMQFHRQTEQPRRKTFIAFDRAYHGDTTGAMSLCDPVRSMHAEFSGGLLEQIHLPIPECDASRSALRDTLQRHGSTIAGVFIEPTVQGAGGMRFHDPDVLTFLRSQCDQHGVLMIADELATGFGRTGVMFGVDSANIVPDIICLGKSLTGGAIGLAATVATGRVFGGFWSDDSQNAFMHGPTFMGNPLACAAACASLDLFAQEPRLQQAKAIEDQLSTWLKPAESIPRVVDVRCKGGIGVIQVDRLDHLDRLRSRFVEEGIWIRPFGDVIYTTPALNIASEDLKTIADAMVRVTEQWSTW
ncbi:adenosylmethionine--8-amino-7-oxononanoate transaminase [Crateriforma spongiae]|uniref:adenosylmethionine--8-amino-7-oxononanoate transaminase n=1 Tax=Crateriforma spongiae TaxID=2724528 RepID=UPI0039B066B9